MGNVLSPELRKLLEDRKLTRIRKDPKLVLKEIAAARSDLKDAKESLEVNKFKWATIQGCYSMFHTGRALLYSKGYREKSHLCLISALDVLYDKIIPKNLIKDFLTAKGLREDADYEDEFSREGSESIIVSAEELLSIARKI